MGKSNSSHAIKFRRLEIMGFSLAACWYCFIIQSFVEIVVRSNWWFCLNSIHEKQSRAHKDKWFQLIVESQIKFNFA